MFIPITSTPLIWFLATILKFLFTFFFTEFTINPLFGCHVCFFCRPLSQLRREPIGPVAVRSELTQGSPACPAKCVGGNTEQQGVQSTVDIPQWEGQIRFQDCLNGKDRVGSHNHVNLHKWWGDIRKVANKKATTAAPEKQNRESVDNSTFWNDF